LQLFFRSTLVARELAEPLVEDGVLGSEPLKCVVVVLALGVAEWAASPRVRYTLRVAEQRLPPPTPASAPPSSTPRRRAAPVNLSLDDAMELGQLLQFLDAWLATDHEQLSTSLARFIGIDGYGVGTLRDDLARFMFLLGETDGEGLFSPRTAELTEPAVFPAPDAG
jgi:hypothetical protein